MKRKYKKRDGFNAAFKERPKQFKEGRKCSRCGKTLNIYNMGPDCLSYCGNELSKHKAEIKWLLLTK